MALVQLQCGHFRYTAGAGNVPSLQQNVTPQFMPNVVYAGVAAACSHAFQRESAGLVHRPYRPIAETQAGPVS